MHIIIDGVFNHVGLTFWAFQDVLQNRENSKFFDWFNIEGSGLPDKSHLNKFVELPEPFIPECSSSFKYTGYVKDLPAFRQDELGPIEPIRNHFHEIIKRWMDPNGDGNPADGIDGWRLDVAERVQIKFWDIFGNWVREINPNAYITGEVWWKDYWNNKQFDASPWLEPGRFDGVMNYKFADAMFKFFIDQEQQMKPSELKNSLESYIHDYGNTRVHYLQNLLGSHDMERLASAITNPDRWIDHANNLQWNPEFVVRKPNFEERNLQKTIIAFQFTFIGTPYIYYGDEVGIWGADDPDCRKPMIWNEFDYEDETLHFCDYTGDCNFPRGIDKVNVDTDLLNFYKDMIHLRNHNPVLQSGIYKTHFIDDSNGIFSFERSLGKQKLIAIFNSSNEKYNIKKKILPGCDNSWTVIAGSFDKNQISSNSFAIFRKM